MVIFYGCFFSETDTIRSKYALRNLSQEKHCPRVSVSLIKTIRIESTSFLITYQNIHTNNTENSV